MSEICELHTIAADHTALLGRLKRIEGQVRGVAGMIENDRYCIDILTQISAIKSALTAVEREVLKSHADHCVAAAIESSDPAERRNKTTELVELLFETRLNLPRGTGRVSARCFVIIA